MAPFPTAEKSDLERTSVANRQTFDVSREMPMPIIHLTDVALGSTVELRFILYTVFIVEHFTS